MNPLAAVALAAASAILFGIFSVLARRAMTSSSAFAGALISFGVGLPILAALSLVFSSWRALTLEAALWFALGGVLAPGMARCFLFLGIRYIGVGRAMPMATITPFLSTLVAILWLGEAPGPAVLAATVFVAAGCVLLSMKPVGDADWRRIFLLLAAHAVVMAFSATLRRVALEALPDPIIGATIATAVSIPTLLLFLPFLPKEERFRVDRRGLRTFLISGVLNTAAFLSFFWAFQYGEVSVVVPVGYSAPLFSLLFARLWLKDVERITWQKWTGALLLISGVATIVWSTV